MKLRFLGQTYSPSPQQIATIAGDRQACFRGQQYKLRAPIANPVLTSKSQLSAVIHKYRGVSYVVERHCSPDQPNKLLASCR